MFIRPSFFHVFTTSNSKHQQPFTSCFPLSLHYDFVPQITALLSSLAPHISGVSLAGAGGGGYLYALLRDEQGQTGDSNEGTTRKRQRTSAKVDTDISVSQATTKASCVESDGAATDDKLQNRNFSGAMNSLDLEDVLKKYDLCDDKVVVDMTGLVVRRGGEVVLQLNQPEQVLEPCELEKIRSLFKI